MTITFEPTRLEVYKLSQPFYLQGEKAEFSQELSGKELLDENTLKLLLENPHLIPEDWKKYDRGCDFAPTICFLGTVRRQHSRNCKVREAYPNGYWVTPTLTWKEHGYQRCVGFLSYKWTTECWWQEDTRRVVTHVAVMRTDDGAG